MSEKSLLNFSGETQNPENLFNIIHINGSGYSYFSEKWQTKTKSN